MDMCRACGEFPDGTNQLSEYLEKYSDIYFNLTSIKLPPGEESDRQRICEGCHLKLLEYNRFRTVCLQVHYKLSAIKKEIEPDQGDVVDLECKPNVDALKIEQFDFSDNDLAEDDGQNAGKEEEHSEDDNSFQGDSSSNSSSESESEDERPIASRRKKKQKQSAKSKTADDSKEQIYPCTECNKKFRSETRFQGHMRMHEGLKPALCTTCGKSFAKYNSLKLHINQKHSENKVKYPCDFPGCEHVYSTKQTMQQHRKKHDPNYVTPEQKRSVCDQCGKTFSTTGALKKHSYIHTGDMPFQCTVCNKKLPTAHKLKEHTMRHEGVKNHVCPYCGMKKTTRHELKVHMNYHTREKQFTCHVCAQVFSNIGNMSRHIRIVHCGIKKYSCTYCERSFGKAETLKHHVMIHTGEKPHECKICGRRFIQSVALQTHMKTHRKHQQQQQQQSMQQQQSPSVGPQIAPQLALDPQQQQTQLHHPSMMMHSPPPQIPLGAPQQQHLQ